MSDKAKLTNESGGEPAAAETPAFLKRAKDLVALRDAVVDAASVGAGLWLSYLFVLFYLAIAAGSVTHRNLFFESPVKLPFLNVDLPLLGFFVLGPGIFLIVHAYVLLHFVLLADKVGVFHAELRAQIPDEEARSRLRRQLPSNIFVQFLAGPREVRTRVTGFLLRLIAQISLVIAPLALLVLFQLQFLPYHNEAIAWWQRCAVVVDLALLWTLWPSVARGETTRLGWRDLRRGKVAAWGLASLLPVFLVFAIATFPGEWLHATLPTVRVVPTQVAASGPTKGGWTWTSVHALLLGGDVDLVARKPSSLWSNRLVLPGLDAEAGRADGKLGGEALSLRGRRLEGAVLLDARLRRVDFTAARLQGATLDGADLKEARFDCAEPLHVGGETAVQRDRPVPAPKYCAQLQGARLERAQLQGASLKGAHLQGAMLDGAALQGATLQGAHLQGASLWAGGDLRGALITYAEMQGAYLVGTDLRGASLDYAQMQGANLQDARLEGASLEGVFVWRAALRSSLGKTDFGASARVRTGPVYEGLDCPPVRWRGHARPDCDWKPASYAALKRLIEKQVPEGDERRRALERVASLDPEGSRADESDTWDDLERSSPAFGSLEQDLYRKKRARQWRDIGCDAKGAPSVIRGILRNFHDPEDPQSPGRLAALATAALDEATCPGARGLSDEDKVVLREIRDANAAGTPGAAARPKR